MRDKNTEGEGMTRVSLFPLRFKFELQTYFLCFSIKNMNAPLLVQNITEFFRIELSDGPRRHILAQTRRLGSSHVLFFKRHTL